MKKVVLYMRYSSDKQSEQSIEGQDRVCSSYCQQNDMAIVDRYIDRAKSASHDTAKRTEFLRMISDAKKRKWDAVVVYKLDRFARDRYDSAVYKHKLKECGVSVISATESISQGPEGVFMESVLEGMAEYYSRELSQKVKRGQQETARKHKFGGGTVPLGLKAEDGHLVPDPATAHIVQEVYNLADEGLSFATITQILNAKGYRTRKGQPFGRSSLRTVLHNKLYIGVYCYNGIEAEDEIEPIIDKDLFWRVQERLEVMGKRKKHRNDKENYLLTGKLYCGSCGEPMVGESGKGKGGKIYRYYKCYGQKSGAGCHKKPIRKDAIESYVIQRAQDMLTDERIDQLTDMVLESVKQMPLDLKAPAIEQELGEIAKKLDNLTDVVMSGLAPKTIIAKMTELEARQEALTHELEQARLEDMVFDEACVRHYLRTLRDRLDKVEDGGALIIRTFVQAVYLYDDEETGKKNKKIKIVYTLDGVPGFSETVCDGSPSSANPNTGDVLIVRDGHIWLVSVRDLGEI